MPDRVGVSVVVKRVIQLECVRPLIGSYPGDIVHFAPLLVCIPNGR
jgi:hypothetical protein